MKHHHHSRSASLSCLTVMLLAFAVSSVQPQAAEPSGSSTAAELYQKGANLMDGIGMPMDEKAAVSCLQRAAEQGHAAAQGMLGTAYAHGYGVEADPVQAVRWWRKADEQENPEGQWGLSMVYRGGVVVPKDVNTGMRLLRQAADHDFHRAQIDLAQCYLRGEGVTQDTEKAMSWYEKAGDQGYARAYTLLAGIYRTGAAGEDRALAIHWLKKAAALNDPMGTNFLGELLTGTDDEEAVRCFRKAAELHDLGAQMNLGLCYILGKGVDKDLAEALRWYLVASDQEAAGRHITDQSACEAADYIRDLKKDLSAEHIAEAQRRAAEIKPQVLHFDF